MHLVFHDSNICRNGRDQQGPDREDGEGPSGHPSLLTPPERAYRCRH